MSLSNHEWPRRERPTPHSEHPYAPFDPVSGWIWGNGPPHIRAYGLDGEMQHIGSALPATYGYGPAGRMMNQHLLGQPSAPQNDTQNDYTLDPLGRITVARTRIQGGRSAWSRCLCCMGIPLPIS